MPKLPDALQQCRSSSFKNALKRELENLPAGALPLEQGTSRGGFVDDSDISVSVIYATKNDNCIQAKVGVFFTEIITGCSCGDEPVAENAYCEMLIRIDNTTSEAEFIVIRQ